jgi:aspartate kinase
MMKIVIQKFGGTSLQTDKLRKKAAQHVLHKVKEGYKPVVVVSAMGRKGSPYATDTLLSLALNTNKKIHPREKDLLLSCGEIISATIMVQTLNNLGTQAATLTGAQAGIITDGKFGNCHMKKIIPFRIHEFLEKDIIPVVAGFQGINENGDITTLGRGGSDTTASVLAVALKAELIEIYSDVKGIMSADPTIVEKAHLLEHASYDEAVELAYKGAEVIHPRAVEIASNKSIPLVIRSTEDSNKGTMIHHIKSDRPVTGIINRNNICYVKVYPNKQGDYETGLKVFRILAEVSISIDFIDIKPEQITFIINSENRIETENLLRENRFNFELKQNYSKVSVVGSGMTGHTGIMAKIVEILNKNQITIQGCTDSHTTISCLVDKAQESKAVNALHAGFELE